MKFQTYFVFFVSLVTLAACGEKSTTPEITQSVEWYKSNNAERITTLEKCRSNPGELAGTPNCVNASQAASSKTWSAKGGGIKAKPLTAEELLEKK